jgi:hypothetical protein
MEYQLPLPGFTTPSTRLSWRYAITQYLLARQNASAPPASIQAFRRDLAFLARLLPEHDPTSLTPKEARWAVHEAKARVAASTAARRHGTWRAFYNWMQEKGWIAASPFCFGFAEATPRPLRPPRYLSPDRPRRSWTPPRVNRPRPFSCAWRCTRGRQALGDQPAQGQTPGRTGEPGHRAGTPRAGRAGAARPLYGLRGVRRGQAARAAGRWGAGRAL